MTEMQTQTQTHGGNHEKETKRPKKRHEIESKHGNRWSQWKPKMCMKKETLMGNISKQLYIRV